MGQSGEEERWLAKPFFSLLLLTDATYLRLDWITLVVCLMLSEEPSWMLAQLIQSNNVPWSTSSLCSWQKRTSHRLEPCHRSNSTGSHFWLIPGFSSAKIYIKVDKCTRENENRYLLGYLKSLMCWIAFNKLFMYFLPIVYIEEEKFQTFSRPRHPTEQTMLLSALNFSRNFIRPTIRLWQSPQWPESELFRASYKPKIAFPVTCLDFYTVDSFTCWEWRWVGQRHAQRANRQRLDLDALL